MSHPMLATFGIDGFQIPLSALFLGALTGLTYGLLGVGLVLIYRTNRIINFAQGQIGAFAAAVFGLLALKLHLPYYLNFVLALALGGLVGAAAEVTVVRRLRNAPRLMTIVATLGLGEFLVLFGTALNSQAGNGNAFPQPPLFPSFNIGALFVDRAYSGILFMGPLVVIALAVFLKRSRYGIGIRSSAANPEAARMAGIFSGRMSSLAWALAGILSAFTAILVLPTTGFSTGSDFGPGLLLRALAAGAVARMTSLPIALAAGVGIGIIEQLLFFNFPSSGVVEVALFVIILLALVLQRRQVGREEEKGSWSALQALRPIPEALKSIWLVRNLTRVFGLGALALALVLPLVATDSADIILVTIMAFSIVGLSIGIITGLGGQLSLGQFALAGIGATISALVATHTGDFFLAFVYAGLGTAVVSLLIALPALRAKGLLLTVSTLAFALAVPAWLLQQPWALGANGVTSGRPIIAGMPLNSGKAYYYFGLAILLAVILLARNVRRGAFGRLLVSIRDNEDNARAFTVRASLVKVQAFLLSGFVAGIGGALFGHLLSVVSSSSFPVDSSINVVAMSVVGGISILLGPLLGALYIIGVPSFIPLDSAGLAATSLGWLVLILYAPGGLAQFVQPIRQRLIHAIARRAGIDPTLIEVPATPAAGTAVSVAAAGSGDGAGGLVPGHLGPARNGAVSRQGRLSTPAVALSGDGNFRHVSTPARSSRLVLLEAVELRKRFGGVTAVDGVSLQVLAGETVGLIGPNGAGKTTFFELLGGFTRPDQGRVLFDGRDVSRAGPEERARLGLVRSFQDAALFPTMSVIEAVTLAFERVSPSSFFGSALGLRGPDRAKEAQARELVGRMGLDAYRDKQVRELSTGTRRITELACLAALRPTLLLLDEPSSGIAQRETEALGGVLRDLKDSLAATLVVIEHDIPLIMGLSDRLVAMDAGRIIASGPPQVVRHDERVVEAYLGGSVAAIERSGVGTSSTDVGGADVGPGLGPEQGVSRRRRVAVATGPTKETD